MQVPLRTRSRTRVLTRFEALHSRIMIRCSLADFIPQTSVEIPTISITKRLALLRVPHGRMQYRARSCTSQHENRNGANLRGHCSYNADSESLCTKGVIDFQKNFSYLAFMNENEVTKNELTSLSAGLRALADACDAAAKEMEKRNKQSIPSTNWKTCQRGVDYVQKFVGGAHATLALQKASEHLASILDESGPNPDILAAEEKLKYHRKSVKKKP